MKSIIVSAADAGFFPLYQDLVNSLTSINDKKLPALGLLDLGLQPEQSSWLQEQGVIIVSPEWDFEFADRDTRDRRFMAQTARPFLPKYFPEFDIFIWMDADTWIQEREALGWLRYIASQNRLAICQELHSAYKRNYNNQETFGKYAIYKDFFGSEAAETLGFTPSINVGVFALAKSAPHWQAWREVMTRALQIESSFFAEQTSLDYAIYKMHLPVDWLPARCNWLCHQALPQFCPRQKKLIEPSPPYHPLWVIHLTMATKDMEFELQTTDGKKMITGLNFRQLRKFM